MKVAEAFTFEEKANTAAKESEAAMKALELAKQESNNDSTSIQSQLASFAICSVDRTLLPN